MSGPWGHVLLLTIHLPVSAPLLASLVSQVTEGASGHGTVVHADDNELQFWVKR